MLLFEILGKPRYTVTTNTATKFVTKQDINGRTIVFIAEISDGGTQAEIEFIELQNGADVKNAAKKGTYKLTGSGGEMQVVSMIGNSLIEMVEIFQPEYISFSAEKEEDESLKRSNIYEKLCKKFIPQYEITKHESGNTILFMLHKT